MGTQYSMSCDLCGLSGVVAGRTTAIMAGQLRTYYCEECELLADLTVFTWDDGDIDPTCSKCGQREILEWSAGSAFRRCNGAVERDGLICEVD